MERWAEAAQIGFANAPAGFLGVLCLLYAQRAQTLYANTHTATQRALKIGGQIAGAAIVFLLATGFLGLMAWLLRLAAHPALIQMIALAITALAALVLLRVPLTTTLGFHRVRPLKARDGAFEILLDRALVKATFDTFDRVMTAELGHIVTPGELAMARQELEPPEIAGTPEEATEEARRYWSAVMALLARLRSDAELPPTILDRAAEIGEEAAEAKRATTTSRIERAVILAQFIDAADERTIPITTAESRRHPLFMRLGGLHAYLWGTITAVIASASVTIAIERPDVQLGWAREAASALRRWLSSSTLGRGTDMLVGTDIERLARNIDASINAAATEAVMTFNFLLKLLAMAFAGASASFDPRIRQAVLAMSVAIFAYYLIAGRRFRYFFILYVWAYTALSIDMYHRYFIAAGTDSLQHRLRSLAGALEAVPILRDAPVWATVRDVLTWIGQISGYTLAVPGTLIWGGAALYFTWYILTKEAALVTFERRMRKPGF